MLTAGLYAISTVALHPGTGGVTSTAMLSGNAVENYLVHPNNAGNITRCLVKIKNTANYIADDVTDLLPSNFNSQLNDVDLARVRNLVGGSFAVNYDLQRRNKSTLSIIALSQSTILTTDNMSDVVNKIARYLGHFRD